MEHDKATFHSTILSIIEFGLKIKVANPIIDTRTIENFSELNVIR